MKSNQMPSMTRLIVWQKTFITHRMMIKKIIIS